MQWPKVLLNPNLNLDNFKPNWEFMTHVNIIKSTQVSSHQMSTLIGVLPASHDSFAVHASPHDDSCQPRNHTLCVRCYFFECYTQTPGGVY
jgi:hypothetical protein